MRQQHNFFMDLQVRRSLFFPSPESVLHQSLLHCRFFFIVRVCFIVRGASVLLHEFFIFIFSFHFLNFWTKLQSEIWDFHSWYTGTPHWFLKRIKLHIPECRFKGYWKHKSIVAWQNGGKPPDCFSVDLQLLSSWSSFGETGGTEWLPGNHRGSSLLSLN